MRLGFDNEARRQANSPSEWDWDHQNWDWEQTPTAAQVYASQRTWDEPYPNVPGNPSRQFVDNAWDNYKKRKNDDRYQDDKGLTQRMNLAEEMRELLIYYHL